ncbi:site-specific DNA-methyltransferase [Variovorax sp. J22G73]|uniref:DNA-methyltransferase n=1 Tax=unclassified Variovorax TaxID=663243 RepID=UPI002575999E|nr:MULTISPECIES: site-specific DNA-methyltransferase [unclassified Variovorax]MDM0007461.1 site-specific DNA-methyltransferase [Variovorax sp. J22R203]MDM0100179.1 site-specific DNA-methyltransferase [Variovorax sp. J22G73]
MTQIYDLSEVERSVSKSDSEKAEVATYKSVKGVKDWLARPHGAPSAVIFEGACEKLLAGLVDSSVDLIVSSPPYCMGKAYESRQDNLEDFISNHEKILPEVCRILKPGGSLCWQVGFHVLDGVTTPLDFLVYDIMSKISGMKLRNRIAWTFGHGLHCQTRFSGRYETVLWYTKGDEYNFDLDAIRVPQKYPGKQHSNGPKKGQPSGNPLGKNPSDVWDIPNVNANHLEKTEHPCQFPVGLVQRLVRALSKEGDVVLDPFCGVASAGVAALFEKRHFIGAELDAEYAKLGVERLRATIKGEVRFRPADRAIAEPNPNSIVGRRPAGFATNNDLGEELLVV